MEKKNCPNRDILDRIKNQIEGIRYGGQLPHFSEISHMEKND